MKNNNELIANPDFIKSKEKKVYETLIKRKDIDINYGTIKYLKEDLYEMVNNKGNIDGFVKENGNTIFMLKPMGESPKFNQAAYLAGYREIKNNKGVFEMYKIHDIDEKTGHPKPGTKEINKFSIEYFNVWKDIGFYEGKLTIEIFKSRDDEGKLHNLGYELINAMTKDEVLKIKDLHTFKTNKQIDKKTFDKALKIIQGQLLDQISDIRFERVKEEITKLELDDYLNKGYISKELHARAIKKLSDVELERQKRRSDKKIIEKDTKRKLEKVK